MRNRRYFIKFVCVSLVLFGGLGLFTVHNNTPARSQDPGTTPTSLILAVKSFALSQSGEPNAYQAVLDAPPVSGTSTGNNTNSTTGPPPTAPTLNDTNQSFTAHQFVNFLVQITGGTGQGQVRLITANTANQLTVSPPWTTSEIPDTTSKYVIMPTFSGTSTGGNISTTLNDTTQAFTLSQFVNFLVEITGGTGAGQVGIILDNTANQLTVSPPWTTSEIPDTTSKYVIRPTVDVIKNNGSAFNAGNLLFVQGTYQGIQLTLPAIGIYSGPDPCNVTNPSLLSNVPIQLPGLPGGSTGEVVLTYSTPDVVFRPTTDQPLQTAITIVPGPVELRLVFIASNSVTCASGGTPQLGIAPLLVSSDDSQSPDFAASLFDEDLFTQYFYSGAIDKSKLIDSSSSPCSITESCQVTGDLPTTTTAVGQFIWRLSRTTPPLPFSNTNLVSGATLQLPSKVTIGGLLFDKLFLSCNALINGQGPPLDLITSLVQTDCASGGAQIASPIPLANGKYTIPHTVNSQPAQSATSTFQFTSTPLLESEFPQPVPTITAVYQGINSPNQNGVIYPITQICLGFSSSSTLTSAIGSTDTTIPVASTVGFPTAGTISIDNEVISYTAVTTTSFTGATRGVGGTTKAPHSNGTCVTMNPNPIIFTQRIQMFVNLPCIAGPGCDVTKLHKGAKNDPLNGISCYTTPGGGLGAPLAAQIFDSGRLSSGTTSINSPANNNCPIDLSDIRNIRYTVGDALGTTFSINLQATGPDLVETTLQVSTTLVDNPLSSSATTINVISTTGFPASGGEINIESENISYTGVTSTSFTGATRGVNGTTAASHLNGTSVTSLQVSTTLVDNPLSSSATTINVISTTGFPASGGEINIESENISYTGVTSTSFTGATRGVNGTTATSHLNGTSVASNTLGTVSPGNTFSVTDTVLNQGTATAGISTTQYYLSLSPSDFKSSADIFLGSRTVSSLPPSVSTTLTGTIASTDTTIPVASITGFPTAGTIDIDSETISYTGVGTTAAACSPFSLPCFTGATRGAAGTTAANHQIGTVVYPSGTLATSTGTATVTLPSSYPPGSGSFPSGLFYVLACANDLYQVLESNEQNNCIASWGTVTVP